MFRFFFVDLYDCLQDQILVIRLSLIYNQMANFMKKNFILLYLSFIVVSIHSYADDLNIQAPGLPQPYNESQVPTPPMPNNTQADVRTVNPISQEMKQAPAIVGAPAAPEVKLPDLAPTPVDPKSNVQGANTQSVTNTMGGLNIPNVPKISSKKDDVEAQQEGEKKEEINIADPVERQYIEDKSISIGTGPNGGIYYPAGEAICRVLNRNKRSVKLGCQSEVTEGSVYNLKALSDGKISFALVQSDWQKRAYSGVDVFKKDARAFENMRFLFSMHNELLTIIVKKGSPISSLNDIAKKAVNLGPEGSGTRALMGVVMNAKGWTKESFEAITSLPPSQQPQALCNKDIDVMIVVTGHPNDVVKEVSKTCEIRMINLANDPEIQNLVKGSPEYAIATIEAGLYQGVPQEIATFGTKATLVTTSDMSDDLVYKFTKAIFTNLSYLKKLYPTLSELSPEKMIKEGQTAPMHGGAARYYKEAGYIK